MSGGLPGERLDGASDLAAPGSRVGAFVVFIDGDGLRHAVRLGSVLALSDGDEAQDATILQLPGARAIRVLAPLDEVLGWFS